MQTTSTYKQQLGMDEIDLQMEREASAIRRKSAITPDRRKMNAANRPERRPQPILDRLLGSRN